MPRPCARLKVGCGDPPGVTRGKQKRTGRQPIDHDTMSCDPNRGQFGFIRVPGIELSIKRSWLVDGMNPGQRSNPHQQIPVFVDGQSLIKAQSKSVQHRPRQRHRTDWGFVVADMSQQIKNRSERFVHRPGRPARFATSVRGPALDFSTSPWSGQRMGLNDLIKRSKPVRISQVVVIKEANIIARCQIETTIERAGPTTTLDQMNHCRKTIDARHRCSD